MRIYGYLFKVIVKEGESGFVAYTPGVGGLSVQGGDLKRTGFRYHGTGQPGERRTTG